MSLLTPWVRHRDAPPLPQAVRRDTEARQVWDNFHQETVESAPYGCVGGRQASAFAFRHKKQRPLGQDLGGADPVEPVLHEPDGARRTQRGHFGDHFHLSLSVKVVFAKRSFVE